jgi:DNA polymerase-3 subunit epsilon
MREIVLDTETTGLDPAKGHRIIEIGCVELFNLIPTSQNFHAYLDPERDIPEEAFRVHGISSQFLAGKPVFAAIAGDFMKFIEGCKIVAHNAEFDLRFVNAELALAGLPPIEPGRVVDTLALARRKFPGGPNSLDALCQRFGIDASRRTKHGALLDAELLADVYAELLGGRQASLSLGSSGLASLSASGPLLTSRPEPLAPRLDAQELERHRAFVAELGQESVWAFYLEGSTE